MKKIKIKTWFIISALFEGDIFVANGLGEFIKNNYDDPTRKISKRGAGKNIRKWNNIQSGDTFIVPYVIESNLGNLMFRF